MLRRAFVRSIAGLMVAQDDRSSGRRLAEAALLQVGVTTGYDPAYARMTYPGGDVSRTTGVCADVVVRAARDGLGLDLQRLVHEDMAPAFSAYPRTWGMAHTDSNIDHRRVLNLETFWRRGGTVIWAANEATAGDAFPMELRVGDELTWLLDARLPHVGIVVATSSKGTRVVQNIGYGAQEVKLTEFRVHRAKGHFRWPKASA